MADIEVKALLKDWCQIQQRLHGPNWKRVLAKTMAKETVAALAPLLKKQKNCCPRCGDPLGANPIFLGEGHERHICGGCWQNDRFAEINQS